MAQTETLAQKNIRLKNRKSVMKIGYKKNLFHQNPDKIIEYLKDPEIVVRVHFAGRLDDETEYMNITIEGIKPE